MSPDLTPSASASPTFVQRPPRNAATQSWEQVRVESIHLHCPRNRQDRRTVACASILLGRIPPYEALVELRCEGTTTSGHRAPVGLGPLRMWSYDDYGDGRFAFEAHVPDSLLESARYVTVNVWPATVSSDPAQRGTPVATLLLEVPQAE